MDTKLTVVIPVYNRAEIVGRTLRSVECQTLRPLRVVLVDNGSTDNTATVLRTWAAEVSAPDFEVEVVSEPTPGAAAARNAGLARVDTPWVMFFDSDDTMRPDHCRRAMTAAEEGIDIVGWDVALHLPGSERRCRFLRKRMHFDNIFHGGMATLRWCVRTDFIRKAGGWNQAALVWDDIELGTRMLAASPALRRIGGEPTVDVYHSSVSISTEPWLSRLRRIDTVLDLIETSLPADKRHFADFKRLLAAGEAVRTGGGDPAVRRAARAMAESVFARAESPRRRALMHLVYSYICRIPHGAVALLSIFLK